MCNLTIIKRETLSKVEEIKELRGGVLKYVEQVILQIDEEIVLKWPFQIDKFNRRSKSLFLVRSEPYHYHC